MNDLYRPLIILYGELVNQPNWKYQRMIDGGATCGYREYARNFGHIIYMSKQKVRRNWEHSYTDPKDTVEFISKYPNAVVWSVKHDPRKDKAILSQIANKKVYYSCNAANRYNKFCDISLVDTKERLKGKKTRLWFKGKDPEYWKPIAGRKEFDYLLVGRRGDKNEIYFLRELNKIKKKRRILWIGGAAHKNKISTNHEVICTGFIGQDEVRNNISRAKVGVLFTELRIEGFPQSFLEMTMCGLPVVYNINAPTNDFYFFKDNCVLSKKSKLIKNAEFLLRTGDLKKCRETAVEHYSIQKSYERILQCLNL
jgi:hypothetical protein